MRPLAALLALIVASLPAAEPPKPFGPTPSPRQLAWMEVEYYGFIHYGLNTYTGKEWGYGDESPSISDATVLCRVGDDCRPELGSAMLLDMRLYAAGGDSPKADLGWDDGAVTGVSEPAHGLREMM